MDYFLYHRTNAFRSDEGRLCQAPQPDGESAFRDARSQRQAPLARFSKGPLRVVSELGELLFSPALGPRQANPFASVKPHH
jgi:hypothetical protein